MKDKSTTPPVPPPKGCILALFTGLLLSLLGLFLMFAIPMGCHKDLGNFVKSVGQSISNTNYGSDPDLKKLPLLPPRKP